MNRTLEINYINKIICSKLKGEPSMRENYEAQYVLLETHTRKVMENLTESHKGFF